MTRQREIERPSLVAQPEIEFRILKLPEDIIEATTIMHHPGKRDVVADVLAIEQFLRTLGYREKLINNKRRPH